MLAIKRRVKLAAIQVLESEDLRLYKPKTDQSRRRTPSFLQAEAPCRE